MDTARAARKNSKADIYRLLMNVTGNSTAKTGGGGGKQRTLQATSVTGGAKAARQHNAHEEPLTDGDENRPVVKGRVPKIYRGQMTRDTCATTYISYIIGALGSTSHT